MELSIRHSTIEDIRYITSLIGELGYPTSYEEMSVRFKNILADSSYCTLLAIVKSTVVGLVGLQQSYLYEKNGTNVRVVALVVHSDYRGAGIGQGIKRQYPCLLLVVIVQSGKLLTYSINISDLLQQVLALLNHCVNR